MKTAVLTAVVIIVFAVGAFRFAQLSSHERTSASPGGLATGEGSAESHVTTGEGHDPTAQRSAGGEVHDETSAVIEAEAAAEPKPEGTLQVAGAGDVPSGSSVDGMRAVGSNAENGRVAAAAPERDERRGRSRWYRRPEPDLSSWTRPEGPPRVALQAGHWKAHQAPDEQSGLRNNGTRGGGKAEWEVNLAIARRTAALLTEQGFTVEILPTTITPQYWADVFVSIHADGHANGSVSGFRAASPRRDRTGRAADLAELLTHTYGKATGLPHYPTLTRRMQSYYAFNYRRYEHSLHPMTVGVILETGFLTSARDRRVIVDAPERAARGIAEAVVEFLGASPGS